MRRIFPIHSMVKDHVLSNYRQSKNARILISRYNVLIISMHSRQNFWFPGSHLNMFYQYSTISRPTWA